MISILLRWMGHIFLSRCKSRFALFPQANIAGVWHIKGCPILYFFSPVFFSGTGMVLGRVQSSWICCFFHHENRLIILVRAEHAFSSSAFWDAVWYILVPICIFCYNNYDESTVQLNRCLDFSLANLLSLPETSNLPGLAPFAPFSLSSFFSFSFFFFDSRECF